MMNLKIPFLVLHLLGGLSSVQCNQSSIACEHFDLNIECPAGQVINVIQANYGRTSLNICPNGPGVTESSLGCSSETSNQVLNDRCNGNEKCTVAASNAIFGDPCGGHYKYLEVDFVCEQQGCRNGDINNSGCVKERCTDGKWIPDDADKINTDNCKKCFGFGDPHFQAFSGAKFAWQIDCNYALVQEGSSMDPEFGVFMNFEMWHPDDKVAHVGGPTIYQENINTKIELNPGRNGHLFNVKVNGRQQSISQSKPTLLQGTSVSAWKHISGSSQCLRLYGANQILVELCSQTQVSIWAPKHPSYELGGLCGSPNIASMQLVGRNGAKYTNPGNWNKIPDLRFGNSWQAKDQFMRGCPRSETAQKRKRSTRDKRAEELHLACADDAIINSGDHFERCRVTHPGTNGGTGDDHHDACQFDLCMVANGTGYRLDGFTVDMMLEHHSEIHHREKVHNGNSIGPFLDGSITGNFQPLQSAFSTAGPFLDGSITGNFQPLQSAFSTAGIIGAGGSIAHLSSLQSSHIQPLQPGGFSSAATGRTGLHRPIGNTNFQRRGTPIGNTNLQRRGTRNGNTNFQRRGSPIGNTNFQRRGTPNGNTNFQRRGTPNGNTNFQRRGSPIGNTNFQRRGTPNGNTNFQRRRNPQPQSFQRRQWG